MWNPRRTEPGKGVTTPTRDPFEQGRALRHLGRAAPALAELARELGPLDIRLIRDPLTALVSSITHQQVSMSAGRTIFNRLRAACPRRSITAKALIALPESKLRGAGLSRQKAGYIRNVAEAFTERRLSAPGLRRMSDDEVVQATTKIVGVGRWTAEMLLIFCLGRPDVWPVHDLGIRTGVARLFGLAELPPATELQEIAEPWRPYRTVASLYLWRSLAPAQPI